MEIKATRVPQALLHATSQHLIGCNEHDADDESNCKGAYEALAHTGLLDMLCWAGAYKKKQKKTERKIEGRQINILEAQ